LSDNIRARSLVGRWLEHSRIYYFGAGAEPPPPPGPPAIDEDGAWQVPRSLSEEGEFYLGSADMMERNLDRRVEAVVQVEPPKLRARLREIIDIELADDILAWELGADGTWWKVTAGPGFDAQRHFQHLAIERGRRQREPDAVGVLGYS
ncbi:MAG: hypothetical protein ACRD0H_07625, partial [Actinomycetes bacterium]